MATQVCTVYPCAEPATLAWIVRRVRDGRSQSFPTCDEHEHQTKMLLWNALRSPIEAGNSTLFLIPLSDDVVRRRR